MGKVVYSLLALNTGIFLAWQSKDLKIRRNLYKHTTLNNDSIIRNQQGLNGLTYGFSHRDAVHFSANMIPFAIFGPALEASKGSFHMVKLTIISIPLGFLFWMFAPGRNYQALPVTSGADAMVASVALQYATYVRNATILGVPTWGLAMASIPASAYASKCYGQNADFSLSMGGIFGAGYQIFIKRLGF